MISRATFALVTLFFLLCEQIQALERRGWLQLHLKSVLQKTVACSKPGYKVRTG